jgi:hypothetical protein
LLSNEDAGTLFKKLLSYHFEEKNTKDNAFVEFAFAMMKPLIDVNKDRYENICKRNASNGSKGGRPKGTKKDKSNKKTQSVILETQKNPKKLNRIEYNIKEDNIYTKNSLKEFWNNNISIFNISKLSLVSDKRLSQINSRISDIGSKEEFEQTLTDKISNSDFLQNKGNWKNVTFDWIVNPTNFAKIVDGNYNSSSSKKENNGVDDKLVKEILGSF